MYLKKINAHGFKSFAEKISIDFNNGITGIVGPNGSGKSNVVDAIRWVLGEQSVKSLRGDGTMTDVLFSGSKSRNPLNVASVTLVFDNKDNFLPLAYEEVSIKRRLYKDGTNEYFINNEKCRLKDVVNLLLDSGIAKESFNIISQGKIDAIISSKPNDRRIIFEEAAGVLKYKRRKEEAIRKLDKTHDNMTRVGDIINELEGQIEPLKEAKQKTLEYNEIISELQNIEIALIVEDITNINFNYQKKKEEIEQLNNQLLKLNTNSSSSEATNLELKTNLTTIDESIRKKQIQLIELTKEVEQLNSQKAIITERQNYNVEDSKLHNTILNLKEKELSIKNVINNLENELINYSKELDKILEKIKKEENLYKQIKSLKNTKENTLTNTLRNKNNLNIKIESLKESIDKNSLLPYAVKQILNNPKLKGIYDVIGNVIEMEEKYSLAISTVLSSNLSNVIVKNEIVAKDAINYLKNNNIGRATFFPINIIKGRYIDKNTINIIKNITGFVDIASNLVKFDPLYKEIIENQLGNVIVAEDINSANIISKNINHRYRIITLDGQLLHVGGSLTGGNIKSSRNVITDKYELEKCLKELNNIIEETSKLEDDLNKIDFDLKSYEDKLYLINKDKNRIEQNISNQKIIIQKNNADLENIILNIKGTDNIINNNLSKEEEDILKKYYKAEKDRDNLNKEIDVLQNEKISINENIEELELSLKKENSLLNTTMNNLKALEIDVNRMDVKLDNLLNVLNENYSLTYENATTKYKLDIPNNLARNEVNKLKKRLKEIGIVNLAAPEEYDRISTRYEFLIKQKEDLTNAENTLLQIISEMDNVMKKEFKNSFEIINKNFTETFKDLFKGGTATLKLTNPNDLLETGIEIIASPPGKKLTTISLLSGGEKTLTAISLLFAIIKSKIIPFCVLDEVEAALDEVNVDTFGNYIQTLKNKTQFILITHKKRTMEYADVLYGITMQESGVSKLVSVKLEDVE